MTDARKEKCIICIETDGVLINYNHCGNYYIHMECLNNWNKNECIICRESFDVGSNDIETNIINGVDTSVETLYIGDTTNINRTLIVLKFGMIVSFLFTSYILYTSNKHQILSYIIQ